MSYEVEVRYLFYHIENKSEQQNWGIQPCQGHVRRKWPFPDDIPGASKPSNTANISSQWTCQLKTLGSNLLWFHVSHFIAKSFHGSWYIHFLVPGRGGCGDEATDALPPRVTASDSSEKRSDDDAQKDTTQTKKETKGKDKKKDSKDKKTKKEPKRKSKKKAEDEEEEDDPVEDSQEPILDSDEGDGEEDGPGGGARKESKVDGKNPKKRPASAKSATKKPAGNRRKTKDLRYCQRNV